jgi:hypothetical protein
MSTTLRPVTANITQSRFSGGPSGQKVQVTQRGLARGPDTPMGFGFIQLTREDAALLAAELLRFASGTEVEEV